MSLPSTRNIETGEVFNKSQKLDGRADRKSAFVFKRVHWKKFLQWKHRTTTEVDFVYIFLYVRLTVFSPQEFKTYRLITVYRI